MSAPAAAAMGPTYRIQLTEDRGFAFAAALVPYLADLGIETLYLSPVAEAVPGSPHGYDGTDPTALRAALGGERGLSGLTAACAAHGLRILLDWVPNHLATWPGGPWWRRLLAGGPGSEMGAVFDVDWDRGAVALPVLDRPLPDALAAGAVGLGWRDGSPVVEVAGTDLPVAGGTVRPGEDVAEVLAAQHYRLVDWHDAGARNYRRFFDIDGLCGVRVEDPEVFDRTHTLLAELAATGCVCGVRVDHVDGLAEPAAYLRRLRRLVDVPVVVEKILTGDEQLPTTWPVAGTTGYEVLDDVGGALVDAVGLRRLVAAGRADGDAPVEEVTVQTRLLVARSAFPAHLGRAADELGVAAGPLVETVARLDRYRTYLSCDPKDATAGLEDAARTWERAAGAAPGGAGAVAAAVLDPARRAAAVRLQQLTGAVMAKGVEDTAWYRLAGPLAFCEVGGDPGRTRADGWARLVLRARSRPGGLVPATTHDTKRSGDVRARLYALSARPAAFEEGLGRLRRLLGLPPGGGDLAAETRVLGQLLLGVLPPLPPGAPGPGDAAWPPADGLAARLEGALVKGAREAKLRTSWLDPDEDHERRLARLAAGAVADGGALARRAFGDLVDEVARAGATLSLTAVVLRHVLPGVPDCYQGDEVWNLSLVDPDNRRPIDPAALAAGLAAAGPGADVGALRRSWRDGTVKQLVTHRCLEARRHAGTDLSPGSPVWDLAVAGTPPVGRQPPLAGLRRGDGAVAVLTRFPVEVAAAGDDLPHGPSYAGWRIDLPRSGPRRWHEVLSGRTVEAAGGTLDAREVLALLPVALLVPEG